MRVTLFYAIRHWPPAIEAALTRLRPEARLCNQLDDGISADLARGGEIAPALTQRFLHLVAYATRIGGRPILFTCSAFGSCIEACAAARSSIHVLTPNEAMIQDAAALGRLLGLLPTLASMPAEFPPGITVTRRLAPGAPALDWGIGTTTTGLPLWPRGRFRGSGPLRQRSPASPGRLQRLADATGSPALSTPDCAVRKHERLAGKSA